MMSCGICDWFKTLTQDFKAGVDRGKAIAQKAKEEADKEKVKEDVKEETEKASE